MTQASWPELLIDVGRLLRRDNIADLKRRSLDGSDVITVDKTVAPDGLAITTARIPDGSEIHVQAELRSTMRGVCLLYTSPSPRDRQKSRMPSSA